MHVYSRLLYLAGLRVTGIIRVPAHTEFFLLTFSEILKCLQGRSEYGSLSPPCDDWGTNEITKPDLCSGKTMRDYDDSFKEMNKENFNLKLRIFFLEERLGSGKKTTADELANHNLELKVNINNKERGVFLHHTAARKD